MLIGRFQGYAILPGQGDVNPVLVGLLHGDHVVLVAKGLGSLLVSAEQPVKPALFVILRGHETNVEQTARTIEIPDTETRLSQGTLQGSPGPIIRQLQADLGPAGLVFHETDLAGR